MPNEIKTRFTLDGEQKYKSAMTEAANAVKVLNSEQKLAQAQFKQTGDAQKYAADQAKILREKIEQQKNAVKAAEQAIKQMAENGVAKNDRKMQVWQEKLNKAQTELVKMQTELQNVTNGMQETTQSTDKLNNSLDSIGKKVNLDAVIGGIDRITDKMEAAIGKAKEMAGALVNAMQESAAWADDLATQSVVYGIDTDTLQRMRYTSSIIDTSVENIVKSRQKLINNMVYGGQDIQDAFKSLGVSVKESISVGPWGSFAGGYRDWEDVFWETGEALMKLTDFEEANARATKIFGRGWEQLKPLFDNDWAEQGFESARAYYDHVMDTWDTVSEDSIGKLTAYDDALQRVSNELTTLQNTVLAQLAPGFTSIADSLSGMLSEFNKYLKSDEGKAKLEDLSGVVQGLFQGLQDISAEDVISFATEALGALTGGLTWIKNNWRAVQIGLEGLAAGFALLKVSDTVLKFMQIMAAGKFLAGGADAAAAGATAGASWGAAFGAAALKAVPWLSGLLVFFENAITPQGNDDLVDGNGNVTELGKELGVTVDKSGDIQTQEAQMTHVIADMDGWVKAVEDCKDAAQNQAGVIDTTFSRLDELDANFGDVIKFSEDVGGMLEQAADSAKAVPVTTEETKLARWKDPAVSTLGDPGYAMTIIDNILGNAIHDWAEKNSASNSRLFDPEQLQAEWDALWSGGNNVEVPAEPEFVEDAAEKLQEEAKKYTVQIGVNLVPVSFGGGAGGGGGGKFGYLAAHANGIWSVPFDGYPAILHRGERVVPAREVNNSSFNSNLYVEKMYMNNGTDAQGLANAMAAAQRRRMSGYGN